MKQLAARADQRWREQESFLDRPEQTGQPQPLMQPLDKGGYDSGVSKPGAPGATDPSLNAANTAEEVEQKTRDPSRQETQHSKTARPKDENPWKRFERANPGEAWQPKAWTPGKIEQR